MIENMNEHLTLTSKEVRLHVEKKKHRNIGIIIFLLGLSGFLIFGLKLDNTLLSTFGLNTGNSIKLPELVLPSHLSILVISLLMCGVSIYQMTKGFGKRVNLILGIAILSFVFSFLIWAISGKSINLAGMLKLSLLQAVPLTLGALSGIMCERSGVLNIGIEGMMLISALVANLVSSIVGNAWIGLLAAIIAGGLTAYIHAILSVKYKIDQTISGMFINIFGTGITSFFAAKFLVTFPELNAPATFKVIKIPFLSKIPLLGGILFEHNILVYLTFILVAVIFVGINYTKWGLRMRMVGEHPRAADTLGVNVFRVRYLSVILGGCLAGMAGAYLTLGSVGRFDRLMTAGRGFIGLAAMIFGNWNPIGAFGASYIFGFASSLQGKLAIVNVAIPSQFLLMAPYIATMIVLVGVVGKVTAPAADGKPYDKEAGH
jgi:simple sugar transport system permease protein